MGTDRNITELMAMAKKLTGYEETRTKLLKQYHMDAEITPSRHKYLVGRAARIARQCIDCGGMADEVKTVLTYMMLCIDAMKYQFDAQKYYTDHIAVLDRKYQVAASK